jgi:hypothetical protein
VKDRKNGYTSDLSKKMEIIKPLISMNQGQEGNGVEPAIHSQCYFLGHSHRLQQHDLPDDFLHL